MAIRLLSWLRSRVETPTSASPVPSVVTGAPVTPVLSGPAVPAHPPGGRRIEPDAATLEAFLRSELHRRLTGLRGLLPEDEHGDDARVLLNDLGGEISAVIRRPPLAAQEALQACRDANASLGMILESIGRDPALAQSLMRHANSSFYAVGGASCKSLHEAAQRVGLAGLHAVLMSALVEGMLCRPGGDYGTMVTQVWTHMVRVAPIARRVGRASGVMPEASYMLGLLHDLGKLIVFDRLSALRSTARHTFRFPRLFLRVALEQLHGTLGGLAAAAWGMDPDAVRAIASHQRTELRYDAEKLSQVLCVAEWADLSTIRRETRDYDGFWAAAGLELDMVACREVLDAAE